MQNLGWYLAMGPLELVGRAAGVYRIGCDPSAPPRVNCDAVNQPVILCFGDSLTAGYGTGKGESYPDALARLLAPSGVEVLNLGRSGETAADGLRRLETEILPLPHLPCTVVVGFGGNDLMQRRPVDETFADIEQMVNALHGAGCLVILLGLRGSWLYRVDYHTPFRELAQRLGCGLVPVCLDGIWGVPWLMADAAHPNARGYARLAARVAAEIEKVRKTMPTASPA